MDLDKKLIYDLIYPYTDGFILKYVLGETISNGIESYLQLNNELVGIKNIDYAEILIEALDNEIFENKNFLQFLVTRVLSEDQIMEILNIFHLDLDPKDFQSRLEISKKSKSKLKASLISILNLDQKTYKRQKVNKIVTRESIKPYTPVPLDHENHQLIIPKEFLSVHDYQKRVKDKLTKKIIFEADARVLVHMPTGSGKTKTSVEAIIDFIKIKLTYPHDPGVILWFAHSKELCEQAYNSFKNLWRFKGDYEVNAYKVFGNAEYSEIFKCLEDHVSIIFIGFQKFDTILKSKVENKEMNSLKQHLIESTKLVVIDEAHKALARTYKNAIDFVTQTNGCRLVGLTATPGRSNYITGTNENQELAEYFDSNIITITDSNDTRLKDPLKYLQSQQVLAEVDQEELPISIDFSSYEYSKQDLSNISRKEDISLKELNIIASDPHRNSVILDKINENKHQSVLVFACSKDHCLILKKLLMFKHGIRSEVILGETNNVIRQEAINNFKNKSLKVLINYGVLSTGFDAPKLNVLLVARPTSSIVLYSQIVGRALRGPRNGGNTKNKLITIKDNMIGFPNPDYMYSYWKEFWN